MAVNIRQTPEQRDRVNAAVMKHFPGTDPNQVNEDWSMESTATGVLLKIEAIAFLTLDEADTILAAMSSTTAVRDAPEFIPGTLAALDALTIRTTDEEAKA